MTTQTEEHAILLNEVRYAERLCQRTARLYRRAQTFGVFVSTLGGTVAIGSVAKMVPPHWALIGGAVWAAFGAALLAVRPGDKAAANESDVRRYAQIRTTAIGMDAEQLRAALAKARESDTQEIELLSHVAWNDVVTEAGYPAEALIPLTPQQKALAALA